MKALIIEDMKITSDAVKIGLSDIGFSSDVVTTGSEGLERIMSGKYDIAIVDIFLKDGKTGLGVVEDARKLGNNTKVIFLSALDDHTVKTTGLNLGGDDYLAKPFDMGELQARVKAVMRRSSETEPQDKIAYKDVRIDLIHMKACRGKRQLNLTPMLLKLLIYFVKHPGRRFSREHLLKYVWNYSVTDTTNVVGTTISSLRDELNAPGEPELIDTERGIGYALL